MSTLYDLLESSFTGGHQSAAEFTQYADTLRCLRECPRVFYDTRIVCHYGGRGQRWGLDAGEWDALPKERVKKLFRQAAV